MRVSVIIATYNYGRFIQEAVDSVFAQDWPAEDLELIVVDDGSTDDTAARLAPFMGRIKYLRQENSGQAEAFNNGVKLATGEIICFLDADDSWRPGKLRKTAAAFAEAADIGMVQHFMLDVDPAGTAMTQKLENRREFYSLADFLEGRASFTGTSGLAFRRSFLEKLLPIPGELFYCADEYLYTAVLFYARIYSINEVLGDKKIHGANWFAGTINDTKRLENYIKVKTVILGDLEARLAAAGIDIAETSAPLPLELAKIKVLYYSRTGDRKKALKVIRTEVLPGGGKRRLFTAATLALGVLHPLIYTWLHTLYSRLKA
ncbi:MAG TPA: hypothetical protein DCS63_00250 [Elusimicrobia bacterium]|nr:hypothetical protein [Elusimicrobiota bacterium]